MKTWIKGALFLGMAYAFFLFFTVPAQLVTERLESRAPLSLSGVSGTAWSGRAKEFVIQDVSLGELQWQLQPLALLTGRLGTYLTLNDPRLSASGKLNVGLDQSLDLKAAEFKADASILERAELLPFAPAGSLQGEIKRFTLEGEGQLDIEASMQWRNAAIESPFSAPLGDFRLDLQTTDKGTRGQLRSEEGSPLKVVGDLNVDPKGNYVITLRLTPERAASQELRNWIKALGRTDRKGTTTFRTKGNIRN